MSFRRADMAIGAPLRKHTIGHRHACLINNSMIEFHQFDRTSELLPDSFRRAGAPKAHELLSTTVILSLEYLLNLRPELLD